MRQNNLLEASNYLLQGFDIQAKQTGLKNKKLEDGYNALAVNFIKLRKHDKAVELLKKVVECRKKLYGNNSAKVADAYEVIGKIQNDQLKYSNLAIKNFNVALNIRMQFTSNKHVPALAKCHFYLANACQDT